MSPLIHVKFKIRKDLDKEKIFSFSQRKASAGLSFKKIIYQAHPELRKLKGLDRKKAYSVISIYVDTVYEARTKSIKATVKKMQLDWQKIEKSFFKISDSFFKNHPWPKGKYLAYFSISPPCPRYLDSKTFAVVYTKNGKWKKIVAHEMLHFIFYDYIRKKYLPSLTNTYEKIMNKMLKDKFIISLWDLSEIFDVILLNDPKFQKILPYPSEPYPTHVKFHQELKKVWDESKKDIDTFLMNLEI